MVPPRPAVLGAVGGSYLYKPRLVGARQQDLNRSREIVATCGWLILTGRLRLVNAKNQNSWGDEVGPFWLAEVGPFWLAPKSRIKYRHSCPWDHPIRYPICPSSSAFKPTGPNGCWPATPKRQGLRLRCQRNTSLQSSHTTRAIENATTCVDGRETQHQHELKQSSS